MSTIGFPIKSHTDFEKLTFSQVPLSPPILVHPKPFGEHPRVCPMFRVIESEGLMSGQIPKHAPPQGQSTSSFAKATGVLQEANQLLLIFHICHCQNSLGKFRAGHTRLKQFLVMEA